MKSAEKEKKVLIITYYWPPSGGSGVQRWLKFVKYLPEFGWIPYVYTPENPSFAIQDESLLKNVPPETRVIKRPIWEPYEIFAKLGVLVGSKKVSKPTELVSLQNKSLFQRLSTWIRANLFFPDPRIFWKKPSVEFLQEFLKKEGIKVIVTTGPPHSMHLIGLSLKQKNKDLRWIADFRDPWTKWDFLHTLHLSSFARHVHEKLERKVLKAADAVISVTPSFVSDFESLGGRTVHLLTNGYDEDDFKSLLIEKSDHFIIRHVGIVNEKCNPRPFMLALKDVVQRDSTFANLVRVEFNGEVHPDFKRFIHDDAVLSAITVFTGNVPHGKLISLYGSSAILLLVMEGYTDTGIIPGKVFEYLATGLPVMSVGNVEGDAALFLKNTGTGVVFESQDSEAIQHYILTMFQKWQTSDHQQFVNADAVNYSRRALTGRLCDVMNSILNK